MRRRPPTGVPADLLTFDVEEWADGGSNAFERYERAMHRWLEARDAWAERTGWEGDHAWWWAQHLAIMGMPDEPWDPSTI